MAKDSLDRNSKEEKATRDREEATTLMLKEIVECIEKVLRALVDFQKGRNV